MKILKQFISALVVFVLAFGASAQTTQLRSNNVLFTGGTISGALAVGGTWTASGTWTLPALTLGGTVSGGGNQINNVIIGTVTPLAGYFTTLSATGAISGTLLTGSTGLSIKGNTFEATGSGAEVAYDAGAGIFRAYNRTGSAYLPVEVAGATIALQIAGATKLSIDASGNTSLGTNSLTAGTLSASGAINTDSTTDSTSTTTGSIQTDGGLGVAKAIYAGTTVRVGGYTVATLPAAGVAGRMAYVTDALAPTFLGALVGGGAVVSPVFDNGAAWVTF